MKLCWSFYYFAEKDYDKAEQITLVHFNEVLYHIATRRIRIKLFFEREEYDLMYSELDSLKVYLYRQFKQKQSILEEHFEANNNFVDYLKNIYLLIYEKNTIKKDKLFDKLNTNKCSDKDWLLEKANLIKA
jgi:hypothetical protein